MSSNNLGLDYFSVDVNILSDAKIIKLIHRYGSLGFATYMILLTKIYMEGYYLENSLNDLVYMVLAHIPGKYVSGKNKLQEIILYLAHLDLLDKELFTQNVITSKGIQERFLLATKKRKAQDLSKYWLLDQPEEPEEDRKELTVEEQVNLKPNKKERIRNRRVKDIEEHAPKKHYLTSCLIEYRYIQEYSLDIYKYNDLFEELSKAYDGDLLYQAVRYLCNYASRSNSKIDDKFNFFESSIKKNLISLTNETPSNSVMDMFNKLFENNS